MAHQCVKIKVTDDGIKRKHAKWCLAVEEASVSRTLCTGDVFEYGDSNGKYESKVVERGGITCPDCIAIIKSYKRIRLR